MADNKDNKQNDKDKGNDNPDKGDNPTGDKDRSGADDKNTEKSVPYHRFSEVNSELAELKKAQKEREDSELKKKGKTDELLTKRESELEKVRTELQETRLISAIERAAYAKGIKDTDAAAKLINRNLLEVKDGQIDGLDEAIDELLEKRPYLADSESSQTTKTNIGTGTSPGKEMPKGKVWPYSEVRTKYADVAWTRAKHDEYDGKTGWDVLEQAEKEGRIDYSK